MLKIVENHVMRGGEKLGFLRSNDIFDHEGRKVGYWRENDIYDENGRKVAYIRDELLKRADGNTVMRMEDLHKEVDGGTIPDLSRAAVYVLLGD